jgi:integrase
MDLIDIAAVKNTGQGAVPFVDFLQTFWDFEKSEYIQSELDHGKRFTRRHAYECMNRVKSELIPFFGDKKMNCVTIDDLDLLARQLRLRGLATSTTNQITLIARKALKWAFEKKIISENPCLGFTKFSIENKERGILNEKEIKAIFAKNWSDKRAYVASLFSASTGAWQGECLALCLSDIDGDFVNIDHGYSPFDGIKCTKTGKKRRVKMIPVTKAALMGLLKDNPHIGNKNTPPDYDPFFFYSMQPDKPCDCKILLKGLKDAMDRVNADYKKAAEKEGREKPEIFIDYKKRNVIFHSWRHYFCTIADNEADMKKVKKVSGHLSDGVFNKYADHIDERDIVEVGNVIEKAFDNILSFRKAG